MVSWGLKCATLSSNYKVINSTNIQIGMHPQFAIYIIRVRLFLIKMKLYHATTQKKAKNYRSSGCIKSPVRGFTTLQGAMAWSMKVGRTVIYEIECDKPHKLPDHHNQFGEAWWNDGDVVNFKCAFSTDGDA